MLIKYYLDILAAWISKAVWFLQLYINQYKELLIVYGKSLIPDSVNSFSQNQNLAV